MIKARILIDTGSLEVPEVSITTLGLGVTYSVNGQDVSAETYRDVIATIQAMAMGELERQISKVDFDQIAAFVDRLVEREE